MSRSINMAINMPSYSIRSETCESIGSKSNNTLVYSHRYECDHDDSKVMTRLNELEKEQNINSNNGKNNNSNNT